MNSVAMYATLIIVTAFIGLLVFVVLTFALEGKAEKRTFGILSFIALNYNIDRLARRVHLSPPAPFNSFITSSSQLPYFVDIPPSESVYAIHRAEER